MAKPFAAFDIDGTLIRWQLFHAITEELAKKKLITPAAYRQVAQARFDWQRRAKNNAFREYEKKLVAAFEQSLTGLSVEQFKAAAEHVFIEYKDQVYTYTRDLIKELKKAGYLLFALSGSPDIIIAKLAKFYSFDDYSATILYEQSGRFTGQREYASFNKPSLLKKLIDKHRPSLNNSLAVGDSELDISLLEMVEKPIAFNPSKLLFDHASKQGWPIVIERKNVIFKLEKIDGHYQLR